MGVKQVQNIEQFSADCETPEGESLKKMGDRTSIMK